jgi:hypothetical protein
MRKIILPIITTIALLITTGCSPMTAKYRVTVDAITAPNVTVAPSTSYTIEALGKNTDKNSLEFQKLSNKLGEVLGSKGFVQPYAGHLAQQTIYFDYGIEKTETRTETYSEPDVTIGMSWGYPYGFYGRHYHPYNNFWYGGGYSTTYRKTYTYYNRYVTILAKDQLNKELWRVDVSSIGESKNLKKIVPMLLEAAEDYIGTNTEEPVKLVLKEKKDKKE